MKNMWITLRKKDLPLKHLKEYIKLNRLWHK